jgi:tetratricopeptide (TPR) repeat protein
MRGSSRNTPAAGGAALERQNLRDRVNACLASGQFAEAVALLEAPLQRNPRDAEILRLCAMVQHRAGHGGAAAHFAERAEAIESHPNTIMIVAQAKMSAGETDEALSRCRTLLEMYPGDIDARLLMARALESAVRVAEAREVIEPLLRDVQGKNGPIELQVQQLLAAVLVHEKRQGEAVELLDRAVLKAGCPDSLRRTALYLRAKACDRLKRYDDAWESAAAANAIGDPQFDPQGYADAVGALMSHWTRAEMEKFPSSRSTSEVPVFIAGMPRSGTSLLDQIIDAHAQAAGVGEMSGIEHFARQLESVWDASLPAPVSFGPMRDRAFKNMAAAYIAACQQQAPGAKRIVNKALGNNRVVGLLARLFPKTRIIHAIRDPRDVAVSCFMGGFNNDYYPWTAKPEWIAVAWEQSRRLMEHWKREADLPILDVRYEDVVTNPGEEFPRFIEFLGLQWDEGCNRFHESKRTVRTLSYDQVNRPLYASSVNRWQKYEKFLGGVSWPAYG